MLDSHPYLLSLDLPNEERVPKNEQSAQIIYIYNAHYCNTDFGKTNPIYCAGQGRALADGDMRCVRLNQTNSERRPLSELSSCDSSRIGSGGLDYG